MLSETNNPEKSKINLLSEKELFEQEKIPVGFSQNSFVMVPHLILDPLEGLVGPKEAKATADVEALYYLNKDYMQEIIFIRKELNKP